MTKALRISSLPAVVSVKIFSISTGEVSGSILC